MQLPPSDVIVSLLSNRHGQQHVEHGPGMIVMVSSLFPFILLSVGIRVYTSLYIVMEMEMEDLLLCITMIPMTIFVVMLFFADLYYHFNRHVWDVPYETLTIALKYIIISQVVFAVVLGFTRVSVLLLARRKLAPRSSNLRLVIDVLIGLILLHSSIFIMVTVFQCSPISASWTISFAKQRCINQNLNLKISCIIDIVSTVIVLAVPIPALVKLQISARERAALCVLYLLGFMSCAAAATRTYFTVLVGREWDQSWYGYSTWICNITELMIGLIGASLAGIQPFLNHYWPNVLKSAPPPKKLDDLKNSCAEWYQRDLWSGSSTVKITCVAGGPSQLPRSEQSESLRSFQIGPTDIGGVHIETCQQTTLSSRISKYYFGTGPVPTSENSTHNNEPPPDGILTLKDFDYAGPLRPIYYNNSTTSKT